MKKKIKVGSDFSGVGAFDQALMRLGIDYETQFACDMDKYARTTYIHNYGEPKYYPENVYNREIPSESLDIYMTSPPCQAFSLAGKRLGKDDKRGILFFNSHEFIAKNKPRYFIFENVKGLLSDDGGKTFQEWVNLLGGKSVNGLPILFAYEDSVPYHIYWKVLNAKDHGVPQNRERVFIVGIRNDQDNNFRFPVEEHLTKRLKDVLENEVENKYFLSQERINTISLAERSIGWTDPENKNISNCVLTMYSKNPTDGEYLKVKSATPIGYEIAEEGDSINLMHQNSETRRGRVGKQVAQTLDTSCNQAIILDCYNNQIRKDGLSGTITQHCSRSGMTNGMKLIKDYRIRRLTPRECFRLMDFPDTFDFSCVSDSQAYKQAGNSIVVRVLEKIIKNLNL